MKIGWILAVPLILFCDAAAGQGPSPALGAGLMEIAAAATEPVMAGNRAVARAAALEKAQQQALREALAQLLGRDTSPRRLELYSNLILREMGTYLLTYKVQEEVPGDQEFTLRISATVKGKALNERLERLGALRPDGGLPTLALYYCLPAPADASGQARGELLRQELDKSGVSVLAFHSIDGCPSFPMAATPSLPAVEEDRKHFDLLLFLRLWTKKEEPERYFLQGDFLHPGDASLSRLPNQACPAAAPEAMAEGENEAARIKPCALTLAARLLDLWGEKSRRYTYQELLLRQLSSGKNDRQVRDELTRGLPRLNRLILVAFRQGEVRYALTYEGTRQELRQKIAELFKQKLPWITLETDSDQPWIGTETPAPR